MSDTIDNHFKIVFQAIRLDFYHQFGV